MGYELQIAYLYSSLSTDFIYGRRDRSSGVGRRSGSDPITESISSWAFATTSWWCTIKRKKVNSAAIDCSCWKTSRRSVYYRVKWSISKAYCTTSSYNSVLECRRWLKVLRLTIVDGEAGVLQDSLMRGTWVAANVIKEVWNHTMEGISRNLDVKI